MPQFSRTQPVRPYLSLFNSSGAARTGEASTTSVSVLCLTNATILDSADNTFKTTPTTPNFPMTAFPAPLDNFYYHSFSASLFANNVNYTAVFSAAGGEVYTEDFTVSDIVDTMSSTISTIESQITSNGGISAVIVSPIAANGSITITKSNDYLAADGRALVFTFSGAPSLIGATVTLNLAAELDSTTTTFTGTVTSATTAAFDIHADAMASLYAGDASYSYGITAVFTDGHAATLQTGCVTIIE